MHETRRVRLVAYGVAVLVTAGCLLIRWPLWPVLGNGVPHMTFFPAVMIAAYFGGLWPGILATILSVGAANYFLTQQLPTFRGSTVSDVAAMILFVAVGTIISGLSESMHRARRRLVAQERQRAEETVLETEERFRQLAENIQEIFWMMDARGERMTYISPGYEEVSGRTRQQLYERPRSWLEIIHPDDRDRMIETVEQYRLGVFPEAEFRVVRPDGSARWMRSRAFPLKDPVGRLSRFAGLAEDISERKLAEEALRESEQRFRSFVDHATDAFFLQDDKGVILDVNRQACESLGYTRDELVGKTPSDFDPDLTPARIEELGRKLNSQEMVAFESRHRRKDGAIFPVEVRGRVFWEGGRRFLVSLARDISERKQHDALLDGQKRILKLIIQGEPLPQVLKVLCRTVEDLAQGEMLASVLLLDTDGVHLRHGAAPSLPESYVTAIDGIAIGPSVGSCGTAAYRRESVYVSDIASDPLWAPYADLALSHGLRACWSAPILSSTNEALGTFALYYRQPRCPTAHDRRTVDIFTRTVAIAIERSRAEEALRESEHRWRSLTETVPQLVWSALPDGACDYFSTQWTQHTGIPESDLLGWRWLETLHPDDREPTRRFWLESVAGRRPYDVEYRVRRQDGVYRWFKTRGVPIRDEDGNIAKWFGTCTDITDLRETEQALRESEERFRGTFENAAVGVAHTDAAGRFLRVNEKFAAIVGYTREELLQRTFQDITHPDDLAASIEPFTVLMRGETPDFGLEKRYLRKDGSVVWVELFVSLQRNPAGDPGYAIAIIRDISERKQLEGELRRAKELAEAANRAKDEFLANVSHEIRTPMNAILGMTELTLDTPMTEDQRQCLKTVKSAADNLLGIINDLLDFAKIEAGKLDLDPADFSLRATLGDTLRALAVRAHRKGLELVCQVQPDVPDALVGDAGRLRQVLLNLVGNAIKFTDEGEVVVTVKSEIRNPKSKANGDWDLVVLQFTVRDTGIGISHDRQEKIFRAFEQEDTSTTRKYGGTGLGLTIAARLVALMGGKITVESEPGRGSAFAFTAQFGEQPHSASGYEDPRRAPPVLLHNLPVLIVDDNATNRRILEEWLRGWQMKSVAVGDGLAAMDALWHGTACGRPYSLVLLDARMPDVDGLALATQIRQRAELSATRLILLTSGDRPGDLARFRKLRVNAHLLKPVQQDELLETIYQVMCRATEDKEARRQGGRETGRQGDREEPAAGSLSAPLLVSLSSSKPLRILVAEDNEFNAQLLEQLLVRRGHRVRLANNGREALALAEEGPFDLLLLDVHMPELDGFQVVQAVRERERTAGGHLPVIALTARARKEDRERCLAAGMDEFVAKPIQAASLWTTIDRVMGARAPADEPGSDLLDPRVVLAACGGDAVILEKICQTFRGRLPEHLTAVREALRERDILRLREAAHKLCGMVSAFSSVAGKVASDIEDHAAEGQLEEARPLIAQLETMAEELVRLAGDLSLETLQRQAIIGETLPSMS
jgi:two-component system, sensor histidine kinase and response regulator